MIHFKDLDEVLQILRDVESYIFITKKNDKLGDKILARVSRILADNPTNKEQ